MRKLQPISEWIRSHIDFVLGTPPQYTIEQVRAHVDERLSEAFDAIRSRVAMGFLRYESNRGRSPCYLEWLKSALQRYEETGNLDALLDAAFYAIAEFDDPSREGTYYEATRDVRGEL